MAETICDKYISQTICGWNRLWWLFSIKAQAVAACTIKSGIIYIIYIYIVRSLSATLGGSSTQHEKDETVATGNLIEPLQV